MLSWGGPRRFLLKAKPKTQDAVQQTQEFLLKDGDLLSQTVHLGHQATGSGQNLEDHGVDVGIGAGSATRCCVAR